MVENDLSLCSCPRCGDVSEGLHVKHICKDSVLYFDSPELANWKANRETWCIPCAVQEQRKLTILRIGNGDSQEDISNN